MTVSMVYASARTRTDRTHLFNGVVIAGSSPRITMRNYGADVTSVYHEFNIAQ